MLSKNPQRNQSLIYKHIPIRFVYSFSWAAVSALLSDKILELY